jgi:hypothetical protein
MPNERPPSQEIGAAKQIYENINENPVKDFATFKELNTNNFYCFFIGGNVAADQQGSFYRKSPAYVQCLQEHPEELSALTTELQRMYNERHIAGKGANIEELKAEFNSFYYAPGYLENLYRAYILMRPYVKRDGELFR